MAKSPYTPSAFILADDQTVADMKQCCHCGNQFVMKRKSGTRRGYCMNCCDLTCGSPECSTCVPFEKRLEEYESGKRGTLTGPN